MRRVIVEGRDAGRRPQYTAVMQRLVGLTSLFCLALAAPAQAPKPPMSPEAVASAEEALAANPEGTRTRLRLLRHYLESCSIPPHDDPVKRVARLRHITYLIQHHPAEVEALSPLFYVHRSGGPYADAGDHELVRGLWVRQAVANPSNARIVVNAARFLAKENKQESEQLLKRAVDAAPSNRRLATYLGFLYATQVVAGQERGRAVSELENHPNALVLAAAATALPNLAMRSSGGQPVDPEILQLSSMLMVKARALAPSEEALRGPFVLIDEYYQEFQDEPRPALPAGARSGKWISVGFAEMKARLTEAPQPKYPEPAQKAGIEGDVRLDAVVGTDGAIMALTTRSGHSLLVPAAIEAISRWRFQPTLLNGYPVEVRTEITVSFPPR